MELDSIQVEPDHSMATVTSTLVNNSGEPLQMYELDTGLRLTGRSVSAESERFDNLRLEP